MLGGFSLHLASASKDSSCSSAFSLSWYQNTYLWRYVLKLESGKGAQESALQPESTLENSKLKGLPPSLLMGCSLWPTVGASW